MQRAERTRLRKLTTQGPVIDGYCRHEFIAVRSDATVREAIQQLRKHAQVGNVFYLYVNDPEGRLVGTVSMRGLLLADDNATIESFASKRLHRLSLGTPLVDAYRDFSTTKFLSLPVVDSHGQLVSVLHASDLLDREQGNFDELFEQRAQSEVFELLGIQAEDRGAGAAVVASHRFPWLLVNVLSGSLSALLIHVWGGRLDHAVQFLAFVPILLILSESVGMQSASVAIASMHRSRRMKGTLRREAKVAFLVGFATMLLVAGVLWIWKRDTPLSIALGVSILVGTTSVSVVGSLVPRLFHRLKIDPRIAAGPVVLALSDLFTLFLYLAVALAVTSA